MSEQQIGPVVDQTMPTGKWEFDTEVAQVFDDMLRRSIPQYDVMRDAVFALGSQFVQEYTDVVDIGCSRGEAIAPFVDAFWTRKRSNGTGRFVNKFVGVEVSEPMRAAATDRFKDQIAMGALRIDAIDLRDAYPDVRASLTLSVFTLQFIPIECRQRVMQDVYNHTVHGGAFVLVEKVLGETSRMDRLMVDQYYKLKADHGYSQEAIERKRLSLQGVLVPVTARWNVELLRQAGFTEVDNFWTWMNFRGWLAIKR